MAAKAKSKALAATVYVDGVAYAPGDEMSAEVAKSITNENAWTDGASESDDSDA